MNERIKELYEQALLVYEIPYESSVVDSTIVSTYKRRQFDAEKFAELIVRECVSKCEVVANMATITNTGEMARKTKATADSCATMIKEHFGVEE